MVWCYYYSEDEENYPYYEIDNDYQITEYKSNGIYYIIVKYRNVLCGTGSSNDGTTYTANYNDGRFWAYFVDPDR